MDDIRDDYHVDSSATGLALEIIVSFYWPVVQSVLLATVSTIVLIS